jgi:plasmid stabilization system protein ParE
MTAFRLSPEATQDLVEIYEYIAQDNIEAAERVRIELLEAAAWSDRDAGQGPSARGSYRSPSSILARPLLPNYLRSGDAAIRSSGGIAWQEKPSPHPEGKITASRPYVPAEDCGILNAYA